jgi:hypothetical protein
VVLPEEEVPLEEEEFLSPTIMFPQEEEEVPTAPLVTVPPEGRGSLVRHVKFFALLFFSKT